MFWLKHVWISFDQFLNAVFLCGYAGETVSAHLWRNRRQTRWDWCRNIVDYFLCWDADEGKTHCETAWIAMHSKRFCPTE